jgi:hypothetical protein
MTLLHEAAFAEWKGEYIDYPLLAALVEAKPDSSANVGGGGIVAVGVTPSRRSDKGAAKTPAQSGGGHAALLDAAAEVAVSTESGGEGVLPSTRGKMFWSLNSFLCDVFNRSALFVPVPHH